ncbi:Variable major protein (plasmid) [Borrelia coriaceae ATCC 43381]|uniref:Variable large protein n=1 Tax=Borrelia coriaceae ATCC 43381 TaxID=1408429 RepID=W5SY14_9SPIR|nr:Variable major protein [Borrelia coriaceae ATCC 43381]
MKINIKNIRVKNIYATLFISLFLSCNNGVVEELGKKKSFADSLINIGHSFQEIFSFFGNAIGDALGFSVVKSGAKKSEIGEHFTKIGDGLTKTKNKLNELSNDIFGAKNADGNTIKIVEKAIKGANEVFDKLIDSVTNLAGVTKADGKIGDAETSNGPKAADKNSVETVIKRIKEITEAAKESGIKIGPGNDGGKVTAASANTDAIAALGGHNTDATKGAGSNLVDEVSKADPWAMIDKIKNSEATDGAKLANASINKPGALAASEGNAQTGPAGAESNADLAVVVALKAYD